VWDLATNAEQTVLKGHTGDIIALAYAPDGKRLASGTRAGALRLWNPATKEVRRFNAPRGGLSALAFSPDNKRLVSTDGKNQVIAWDLETAGHVYEWPFASPLHSLAFSPNGLFVAAGTEAGTIHIFRPDRSPPK
jgi:WD40 repeat protein